MSAGLITTSTFPALLVEQLRLTFGLEYEEYPTEFEAFYDMEKSNKAFEFYQEVGGLQLFKVKPQGQNINFDTPGQGFLTTLTNVSYGNGFAVTHEMEEDDLYNVINKLPKDLAMSARQTKEIFAQNVLNDGFTTLTVGADGVCLFNVSHPTIDAGVYKNRPTLGSSLSETSLNTDCVNISNLINARGRKIMVVGKLLVIPRELENTAKKLLISTHEAATANNAINPFARQGGLLPKGYKTCHFLTNPAAYFIRTSCDGLVYQNREDIRFMEDVEKRQLVKIFTAFYRAAWGWYDPRSIYGNPGS